MSTLIDTLPVILVSAADEAAATALISELIDHDVTEDYLKDNQSPDRVWRLVNKYYSANVRVHPLTDNGQLKVDLETIEAHIIYITKEELSEGRGGAAAAERRAAGGVWRRVAVRLLLLDGTAAPPELGALCGWRAHVVPLREAGEAGEAGAAGHSRWEEARAALHAHTWRGLQRTDRGRRPPPPSYSSHEGSSSSSCAGSDDEEADELRAVEHAEAFAAALGALGPALSARGPPPSARGPPPSACDLPPSASEPAFGGDPRHDRAEALVAAFCRALGYDLDTC